MISRSGRPFIKILKRRREGGVSFDDGSIEPIVGRPLLCLFPEPFNRVEFGRIGWKSEELDSMPIGAEPCFSLRLQIVARTVVEHEKYFSATSCDKMLEKAQERVPIEDVGKLPPESRPFFQRYCAKYVRRFSLPKSVDSRLNSHSRPCLVECSVKPEAGFILKHHDPSTGARFFLILGNLSFTQFAWASRFARASRFLGLWTENPS